MTRAVAELREKRLGANILPVGAQAPAFELPDHDGKIISSSHLLATAKLVICFIRGRWCPFVLGRWKP